MIMMTHTHTHFVCGLVNIGCHEVDHNFGAVIECRTGRRFKKRQYRYHDSISPSDHYQACSELVCLSL